MPSVGDIMAGRAFVLLYAHDTPLYRGLRMAEHRVQQFAYNANRIGRSMLTLATAVGAPMAIAARTYAAFQDQMLAVQAVTRATGQEFDRLYEQAKKLGATTSFTAGQVAGGQLSLARQGFSPAEIEAAIPSVLALARATGTDLAIAADIASGTLRAFNLAAEEMPRVADVMVATANNSAQTLEDLGESMKYAAPIAAEYGLTIEQTAKALGVMANMQIKGSMAGTSLRQIMLALADADVQTKLKGMGVDALDASKNLRPLGDVMLDIGRAMAGMSNAERISLAKDLFDQRAVGGALKLISTDFDGLSQAIENAAGIAQQTSDTMDSGLGGTLRILKSAIEGVQIALGEALDEQLTAWGTTSKEIAEKVQAWIKGHKELIVTVAKIAAGLAAFGVAAIGAGAVASGIASVISLVSMGLAALNPVVLAIGAVVAGAVAAWALWGDEIKATLMPAFERAAEVWRNDVLPLLADLWQAVNDLIEAARPLGDVFIDLLGMDLQVKMQAFALYVKAMAEGVHLLAAAVERLQAGGFKNVTRIMGFDAESNMPAMPRFGGTDTEKAAAAARQRGDAQRLDEIGKLLGVTDEKEIGGQLAAGEITSEEALKMNEEMQDRISEYRIQRIKDEQDRIIAEINRRYEAERKKAEELGASLSMVEEARKAAIATADEKYRQQQEAERSRKKEAADASNAQMRGDIARIQIERASGQEIQKAKAAGASSADIKRLELDRERKLLELQRQRSLQDAKKQGLDLTVVNELYDARLALSEQQAQQDRFAEIARGRRQLREAALAPTAQMGSLEAYQAIARHGDPALRIQENQLRKLADIEHNTARAADAAEQDGYEEVGLDD
jgi:TP901 family phage tail tape measure protein